MVEYLNQTLGLRAEVEEWKDEQKLPLYLRSEKKYFLMTVGGVDCLLVEMEADNFKLSAYERQISRLMEYASRLVVLQFEQLTSYQRKILIEQKIPFIVPNSQIYLPFLGVVLQERMQLPKKKVAQFSAIAQYVLLHFLYSKEENEFNKTELADMLGVTAMGITRAVQELSGAGLVETRRNGRCDYVLPNHRGKELYEDASGYLQSPVQKRVFVKMTPELEKLPLAGETALAERTMLNPPATVCRAIERRAYRELENIEVIDPSWYNGEDYIQLELWKYNPKQYVCKGIVDAVSLKMSLTDNRDERVEEAVEQLMGEYKW